MVYLHYKGIIITFIGVFCLFLINKSHYMPIKLIQPQYYIENLSLRSSLRNNSFEVFKNDKAGVGALYMSSILDFEVEKTKVGQKREICVFSENLRSDVFTDKILNKFVKFLNNNGKLYILVESDLNNLEYYDYRLKNYPKVFDNIVSLCGKRPEKLKTTCFLNNESFAYELVDSLKDDRSEHEAYFCINCEEGTMPYDKRLKYRSTILNYFNGNSGIN